MRNIAELVSNARATWEVILPHIPAPEPFMLAKWSEFPDFAIEQSLIRTAAKFTPKKLAESERVETTETVYHFATGTMRHIARAMQKTAATATREGSDVQENFNR
jgi:hypothetical protein